MFEARLQTLRQAIDVVLRRLQSLPPSDKAEQLGVWVQECMDDAEQLSVSSPTPRERDVLAKRVLALHVEVANLEREARLEPLSDRAAMH